MDSAQSGGLYAQFEYIVLFYGFSLGITRPGVRAAVRIQFSDTKGLLFSLLVLKSITVCFPEM